MSQLAKLNFNVLLKDAQKAYHTLKAGVDCPLDEMLLDYVYHDIPKEESTEIAKHIKQCERCRIKTLKMEVDCIEWNYMFEKSR